MNANLHEEMLAEFNARHDDVFERYAGSAPDPRTEHEYAMLEMAEEVAREAAEAGMTVEDYLADLAAKRKAEEDARAAEFSDDDIPF